MHWVWVDDQVSNTANQQPASPGRADDWPFLYRSSVLYCMILRRVLATPDLLISRAGHLCRVIRWIQAHTSCHRHPLHRRCDLPSARPSLSDNRRQPGSGTTTCLALPDNPLDLRREREFWGDSSRLRNALLARRTEGLRDLGRADRPPLDSQTPKIKKAWVQPSGPAVSAVRLTRGLAGPVAEFCLMMKPVGNRTWAVLTVVPDSPAREMGVGCRGQQ